MGTAARLVLNGRLGAMGVAFADGPARHVEAVDRTIQRALEQGPAVLARRAGTVVVQRWEAGAAFGDGGWTAGLMLELKHGIPR